MSYHDRRMTSSSRMSDRGDFDLVPINRRDPFMRDPFFSSTWDDFERMRGNMIERSQAFWRNADREFADFDTSVRRQHDDMDRGMAPSMPRLPQWAVPDHLRDRWQPMLAHSDDVNDVINVNEGSDKFEVTLDVSAFRPEELKVKTINNVLSVEAHHEEATGGQEGATSNVVRHFSRKWTLPSNCRPEDVVSNLSSDGILMVTAPRSGPAIAYASSDRPAIKY